MTADEQNPGAHAYEIELLQGSAIVKCSCGFSVLVPRQFAEVVLKELHENGHLAIRRIA